ncbi:PASTA domain-containing protein [Luteibaculum oceani]|uniref:PASTA domain-containing protein n=1 Tax=Luteibaculum oceani TaxID=1294296 RepID=A0A5C6VD11_9FLAO|nr:PASTA domain-containing protein [Luteibaculum oceani]TXC81515.1 PASTA domain-containing protein [Luteibaculum oceani]
MAKFLRFIFSKIFLINLIIAVVLLCGIVFGIDSYLKGVTKHGEKIPVPMLIGKLPSQVDSILVSRDLKFTVIDSVYESEAKPGQVLEQIPEAFQNVKPGRTIYLTINTLTPPNISIPNLKNMSLRQAVATLEVLGLKLHKLEYEPDICVDCVLKQLYEGEEIEPGTKLPKGAAVTLVLGQGTGGAEVQVPYLIGLNLEDAVRMLIDKSLNIGDVEFVDCETRLDSNYAQVFRQSPSFYPGNKLRLGSEIKLWFTGDTNSVVREDVDSLMMIYQMQQEGQSTNFDDLDSENSWE